MLYGGSMLVWLLLACGSSSDKVYAEDIIYKDGSVQDALSQLESRISDNRLTGSAAPTLLELSVQVSNLEDRMSRVELETTTLKINGLMPAENVSYDPRATTLSARDLQTALDELTARLEDAEEQLAEDMGEAGPGLFEVQGGGQSGRWGLGTCQISELFLKQKLSYYSNCNLMFDLQLNHCTGICP